MHRSQDDLDVMFEGGGASVRSLPAGGMFTSIVVVPAGADFTDALKGLPNDMCPSEHWGYMLDGTIHLRYLDDSEETSSAGEVFHWPAGHTAWSPDGARFVEVSPERAATPLFEHMNAGD